MTWLSRLRLGSQKNSETDYTLLPDLHKSQFWSIERLREFQLQRLKLILKFAYENVPGYRQKYSKVGVVPEDLESLEDLTKFPVITRAELQNNPEFVLKDQIYETLFTGGSTGDPLEYYESEGATAARIKSHERGWGYMGYTDSDKLAVIASAQGIVGGENVLNLIGELDKDTLPENISQLKKFKPRFIRGYVSSVYILAKFIRSQDEQINGIEAVNVISENLYDYQREVIEEVFGCRVFEEYVGNDGGASAWECESHEGLHYAMERSVIEEVDGEIVVTDLWNQAMPFIRYKNGDSVEFLQKSPKCGRRLPLIKVRGRDNDILITPTGTVSPTFLLHHGVGLVGADLKNKRAFKSGIDVVQYIQNPGYRVIVNAVVNENFTDMQKQDFLNRLELILPGMEIEFHEVDKLLSTKKGKRAFIINNDSELLVKWRES